ncbi:hypothetical protein OIU80_12125 [Flavobacterium sp. LS1R47]|uniref:Uncharacterized protein n=1 Tax=Flavobacterium frigoritolerans TaxID=2987686 RepID=A0A9X2ZP52_9FLAO|nr:hypothetical protein [Flavobacterium frigoritolerans]MCV9933030.1 hypothetical protein [Flavobacterium frigoritolerans]
MDFSEDDEYDGDAVLFQQGYDMDVIEVQPGDTFEIDDDCKGQVNREETQYKLIKIKKSRERNRMNGMRTTTKQVIP